MQGKASDGKVTEFEVSLGFVRKSQVLKMCVKIKSYVRVKGKIVPPINSRSGTNANFKNRSGENCSFEKKTINCYSYRLPLIVFFKRSLSLD